MATAYQAPSGDTFTFEQVDHQQFAGGTIEFFEWEVQQGPCQVVGSLYCTTRPGRPDEWEGSILSIDDGETEIDVPIPAGTSTSRARARVIIAIDNR